MRTLCVFRNHPFPVDVQKRARLATPLAPRFPEKQLLSQEFTNRPGRLRFRNTSRGPADGRRTHRTAPAGWHSDRSGFSSHVPPREPEVRATARGEPAEEGRLGWGLPEPQHLALGSISPLRFLG